MQSSDWWVEPLRRCRSFLRPALMGGVKLRLCSLTPTKMHGGVFNVDSVPHEDTQGTVCGDTNGIWKQNDS